MSQEPYRAGIVGLGFIGAGDPVSGAAIGQRVSDLDGTHAAALAGCGRVDLVVGSSRDPGRRERFGGRYGARTYGDWREMLAEERLDIVSVATYTPYHAEIAVACAEAGVRAVYCEKPMASSVADARAMIQACERTGTLLVINHNRRFNPVYRRLRDALGEGLIGDLTSASMQWGGGRLGNVGTHIIDALAMLTGRRVVAVSGTLDRTGRPDCRGSQFSDPGGWGLLRLEDGLMVTVDAGDRASVPLALTINGSLGRVVTGRGGVEIAFWDGTAEPWAAPDGPLTSMDRAVAEMAAWLDGTQQWHCAASEALHVLEAITAFHVSDRRNAQWTDLPLGDDLCTLEIKSG